MPSRVRLVSLRRSHGFVQGPRGSSRPLAEPIFFNMGSFHPWASGPSKHMSCSARELTPYAFCMYAACLWPVGLRTNKNHMGPFSPVS
eukprot:7390686-Pyramimonas_sp.AAC.1